MSIIWMLVVGLVVGAIAKLMMPGKDPGGIFVTMLLGVAGALVAGFLGRGWDGIEKASLWVCSHPSSAPLFYLPFIAWWRHAARYRC